MCQVPGTRSRPHGHQQAPATCRDAFAVGRVVSAVSGEPERLSGTGGCAMRSALVDVTNKSCPSAESA